MKMARHNWTLLNMAGTGHKWLKMAENSWICSHFWKLLEIAKNAVNCQNLKMKCLEMFGFDQNKWLLMAGNSCKMLKMDGNG